MTDKKFLKQTLELAKKSADEGGFPAGAVIVKDGKVVSKAKSLVRKLNDPTSHAEVAAIRKACNKLKTPNLSGATLYTSLEPCLMCFSAINWAGISKIVFGCRKTESMVKKGYYEGSMKLSKANKEANKKIKLVFLPDFEKEVLVMIRDWESKIK